MALLEVLEARSGEVSPNGPDLQDGVAQAQNVAGVVLLGSFRRAWRAGVSICEVTLAIQSTHDSPSGVGLTLCPGGDSQDHVTLLQRREWFEPVGLRMPSKGWPNRCHLASIHGACRTRSTGPPTKAAIVTECTKQFSFIFEET